MSSTAMSLSIQAESRTVNSVSFPLRALGTVAAAVAANALFYFLGGALVTYDPEFVVLANVSGAIIFTLAAAVVAVLVYAALRQWTQHAAGIFKGISAVVFIVTLIPDFTYIPTVPGSSNDQTAILVLMHVVAAAVIVPMLTATARSQSR
jgi:hypothetical protein